MPTWLQITLAIGVPFLTVAVTAAVTVITKFAKDREEANDQLFLFVANVLKWLGSAAMLVGLYTQVVSKEPLTRIAVFTIALTVSALTAVLLLSMVQDVVMRLFGVVERNIMRVGRLMAVVEERKDASPSTKLPASDATKARAQDSDR